jgi:hypothetical protein
MRGLCERIAAQSCDERRSGPDAYRAVVAEAERSSVEQAEAKWRSQLGPALYWTLVAELEAEGVSSLDASRMALRVARACVLRLSSVEQRAIPGLLGVGERTCDSDLKRWRRLVDSGDVQLVALQPLPPIPRPDDRVSA